MITLGTAKATLDQFVGYVALEVAPHGITANLVAPATVQGTRVTEQLTTERMHQARRGHADAAGWSDPTMSPRRWRSGEVGIRFLPGGAATFPISRTPRNRVGGTAIASAIRD